MQGAMGWIVAAIIVLAAAIFYFWPSITAAPANTETNQATSTSQVAGESQMAGTWKSTTDEKFTREIRADGVIIDRYEGEASAGVHGEWTIVNPLYETGLPVPAASLEGKTVVKVAWEGGVETTLFVINAIDERAMTITDLTGQGEVTTFMKI